MKMELQSLLEQKPFADLTHEEQVFVLGLTSKEAYEIQRKVVQNAATVMDKEAARLIATPPSATIMNALKAKQAPIVAPIAKSKIRTLLNYKIAAWQAIAASLVLFVVLQVVMEGYTQLEALDNPLLAGKDTVYIEKYIKEVVEVEKPADTLIKVVYKTVYVDKENPQPITSIYGQNIAAKETPILATPSFANVLQYATKASGQPASRDTFLQLMTQNIQY